MTFGVLRRVFRHPRYILVATGVAFIVLSATLLLPNHAAILQIFSSHYFGWGIKLSFLWSLYGSLLTSFTLFSGAYTVALAVLFGINIALLTFYIRRRQEVSRNTKIHLSSVAGLVSGIFGIGCAACGSVIITSVLGLFGASSLLLLLPFHGAEFGVLGIVLLSISIRYLMKHINDPLVCPSKL
jgi:hypothetical protein